jgi:hypothetical protein
MSKRILATATVALLGLIAASDVSAATGEDRWLPFQGCWRADGAPSTSVLCIVQDGQGVRLIELADGAIARETRMVADGQPRAISQEGCTGTEKGRWSADGRRLYLDTELTCGDQLKRTTVGVFSMISPMEWVSINAVVVDNEAATRTVKYQAVETSLPEMTSLPGASRAVIDGVFAQLRQNRLARETARYAASRPLTLEQVRDASKEVHPRAIEALLLASRQQFDLSGKKLLALADAGVPTYLIDAVVAVSNPDRFEVKDRAATFGEETGEQRTRSAYAGRYCDAWDDWYDPWCRGYGYNRYSPFGYYGYNNYGYNYYGSYYGLGFRGAPIIVVRGDDTGQVTRGSVSPRGYTSGSRSSSGSPSASRSGTSGGSSTSSSGGSSSSGSATTSSSGGSSTVTGKAKPRGGSN